MEPFSHPWLATMPSTAFVASSNTSGRCDTVTGSQRLTSHVYWATLLSIMPGSSWRFKEKERQNQMRAIIEDAVSKETKSLVAAGYYYLPIDQIRGKALVHLGIPSIFGGNINWAKIGPSFRLRIPRQRESPFLLPTYLGPRKFFKTRLPRRPERHFQDRAPQPRCVGGPEVLIVPRVETHESAGRTRARSTAARARRAAAAATADLPTETLKLTSSFLASSSADLRRGRGSPVVSRLPESKASERLAQLRSPEAKAAKARQDENTVPVQGRDGARAAAAAASSRALGEHGPHDEPLPAPVEGFDADAPVAVVAELPLADIDLNAAVVPTGGVSGSAARRSGRDGSVDFTVTFSKSAHIPAPASQADRALKRKSLSLAKRKAPVSVKGVAHSPRIAKQGAVEVAAPSPIASLGRAAPSLDLCSATTIVCSPSSRASGFKIPSPSSTLRQRLESPNMSLDAVELLEDARPPPSPIPTLPHTCDTAPSGSSEKTMSDRKASVFDIEVNRSEISIASVLNTSRMSRSSVSRDIIPVGHTPARYVANVPPPPVRVSSSSSEDGANRTSESIDAVLLRGAARRPPTPVPTPPQAYDTTSSGSSDKAMSDRKTAASESDSSDVIQSSQRSPLPLVAVFDKEKQLSLSPPSLSSTVASGGRKRREGSSGSSRGLTPLSGEQQRAVRKLFDESPPREVAEVAAAASGGDSVGEAIGDELSINTSRMSRSPLVAVFDKEKQLSLSPPSLSSTVASGGRKRREGSSGSSRGLTPLSGEQQRAVRKLFDESPPREVAEVAAAASGGDSVGEAIGDELSINTSRMSVGDLSMRSISDLSALSEDDEGGHHVSLRDAAERAALATESLRGSDAPSRVTVRTTSFAGSRTPSTLRGSSRSSVSRDNIPVGHTPARHVADVPPPPVRASSSSEDGANRTSESIDAVFLRGAARRPPTPVPTPPQAYDTTSSGSSEKKASDSIPSKVAQRPQKSPPVAVFDKQQLQSPSPHNLSSAVPAAHDTTSTSSRPPGPSDAVSAASGTKRPLKSPPLIRPAPSSTTTTTKSSSKISVPSESSSSVPSSAAALAKVGASHSPPPSQSKPTPKRARMSISDAILLSGADPGRATAPAAESRPHASIRRSIAMMTPGPEETAPGPSATSPQGRRRSRESRASPPRGTAAVPTRQKTSVSVERIRILLPSHDQDSGHDRDLPAAQRSPSAAVEERGGQAPRQSSRMSPPSGGAPRRRRSTEKSTPSARRNTSSLSISDVDLGSEFDVDLEPANVSGGEEESSHPYQRAGHQRSCPAESSPAGRVPSRGAGSRRIVIRTPDMI
ncbi:hypothetical protein KUF71_004627 [Frankliniella fusca]|uniref:Uncharacterized protein n=1 Tax=Frankliniella fusca TaxID=407009 RepID=A0AAE1HZG0_9NEOP|nr:hypothetical protein KUF71_004627 [Frankliniella fusca]